MVFLCKIMFNCASLMLWYLRYLRVIQPVKSAGVCKVSLGVFGLPSLTQLNLINKMVVYVYLCAKIL